MKGRTMESFIASLPQRRQLKIQEGVEQLCAEYMALQEIRKAMNLTQEQLAGLLEIDQANLSRMEKRTDVMVSTLRRYIEAVGGTLHIMATLPTGALVELVGLSGSTARELRPPTLP